MDKLLASNERVEAAMALRKGTKFKDVLIAGTGAESFDGLGSYDVVSYANSKSYVGIDLLNAVLNAGEADHDTFASIEAYALSRLNDWFAGSNISDSVNGDLGNDRLDGRAGNDGVNGHAGNDTLIGGSGNDGLWGGSGEDSMSGGTGNDLINGDSHNDRIDGGDDSGAIGLRTTVSQRVVVAGGINLALSQIDAKGEVALLPTPWSGHAPDLYGIAVSYLGVVDGDMLYAVSNRMSFNTTFALLKTPAEWSGSTTMHALSVGATAIVNMGPPNGVVPPGVTPHVFLRTSTPATPLNLQDDAPHASLTTLSTTSVSSFLGGDTLNGGSGSDVFAFTPGLSGVDRITGFVKGQDLIDTPAIWFDGNANNGEFKALSYSGGTLIAFTDSSSDGFVNDTGILLMGVNPATVDRTLFI